MATIEMIVLGLNFFVSSSLFFFSSSSTSSFASNDGCNRIGQLRA